MGPDETKCEEQRFELLASVLHQVGVPRHSKLEPDRWLCGIDAAIAGFGRICGLMAPPNRAERGTQLLPPRIGRLGGGLGISPLISVLRA